MPGGFRFHMARKARQKIWNPLAVFGTPWRGFQGLAGAARGCQRVPNDSKGFWRVPGVPIISLTYTSYVLRFTKRVSFYGGGGQKQTFIKMWIIFLSTKKIRVALFAYLIA